MAMSDKCATHVLDKGKSESCLVKAPALHTDELVLVVSELLCTSVQGNTQGHKQGNAREMCSCWETVNTEHVFVEGNRLYNAPMRVQEPLTPSPFGE